MTNFRRSNQGVFWNYIQIWDTHEISRAGITSRKKDWTFGFRAEIYSIETRKFSLNFREENRLSGAEICLAL
ncbi:hypothetical protein CAT723_04850 [Corynebacterium ammoniagenes]|uniref:Uncharacterized protein n=1 Tax=Corynebacterium ammoniagenes TaxID=1697 RepID=A0AAV5G4T3_CORAM|nr:hypothetical protein CAT723_04850 [Corynebacterium ammoniagenes]